MAEEVAETVEVGDSQAAEAVDSATADTEPAPEGASDEEAASSEEAPSFSWDEWDGTIDELLEEHREIGGHFHKHYDARLADKDTELSGLRELYDALLMGKEDPRIAKMQEESKSFEERYKGLEEKFNDYKSKVEAAQEAEARDWAARFEEQHKEILSDKKNRERMVEFLDKGWEAEYAVKLLTMNEEFVEVAEEAKGNGVPDSYAIRLAETSAGKSQAEKKQKATPRPGARITAGATGAKNPQQAIRAVKDTDTLEDRRMIAARAALKAVKGGRR